MKYGLGLNYPSWCTSSIHLPGIFQALYLNTLKHGAQKTCQGFINHHLQGQNLFIGLSQSSILLLKYRYICETALLIAYKAII